MKFVNLMPPYLEADVAIPVAKYCTKKYGKNGFRLQSELEPKIEWRPTIQVKTSAFETHTVEISEILFPAVLKSIPYDLQNHCSDHPVVVYVGCPLAVYQADQRHSVVSQLRANGFGIYTVDDVGNVIEQVPGIPLIHHIPQAEFTAGVKALPSFVRVKIGKAYDVYKTRSYQGLQDVAQVVEAIVFGLAKDAHKGGWISGVKTNAADVIDDLYNSTEKKLKDQRAAIGLARGFSKYYRNISSHPPKTRVKAAELIKNCRKGFLMALEVATALTAAVRACDLKVRLVLP